MRTNGSGEHPLLSNERLDVVTAAILIVLTAALFVLVSTEATRPAVQRIDDAFLHLIVTSRSGPVTVLAHVFDVLGSVWVTLPVRIAAAAFLAAKRRWWHLTAFLLTIIVSEATIGPLKDIFGRERPPGSLVATSGASFPSGHAVATSLTLVALVIALFPSGPRRWAWGFAAALFSFLMALSRAYLAAHWLSDVVAGTLLGTGIALLTALLVQEFRETQEDDAGRAPLDEPANELAEEAEARAT